jgi:energy-coupling factor transporter transmembrane protein EcfT
MAELTAFNYFSGNSWLHRLDIRFKLIIVLCFNMISIQADISELMVLSIPLILMIFQIRIPIRNALSDTRYFLYFLVFIFLTRTMVWDKTSIFYLNYSYPDMLESFIICWRLFLILMVGLLFMYSSKILEIKAAIQWFLTPVPFIPEKKIAFMIGLMIRFVPDILQHALDIKAAQSARGVEHRKNLIYRITVFSIPLFQRIFEQADTLVYAMLSRCYTEDRSDLELTSDYLDWIILVMATSYLLIPVVLNVKLLKAILLIFHLILNPDMSKGVEGLL